MNNFEIQVWLNKLAGAKLAVDGKFGALSVQAAVGFLRKVANVDARVWAVPRVQIAATQLIMRVVGNLNVGPIDGIMGPATAKALAVWQRGNWRTAVLVPQAADKRMPEQLQRWPTYEKLVEFYGEPGQNLVTVTMPYPRRLSWQLGTTTQKVRCHKKVADSLVKVHRKILADYGYEQIQRLHIDIWGGCFQFRPMRGTNKLSTHAWGIAEDIDPIRNALRATRKTAALAQPIYEKFWEAWTNEGWLSLGKARDFDWMHVQACRL